MPALEVKHPAVADQTSSEFLMFTLVWQGKKV